MKPGHSMFQEETYGVVSLIKRLFKPFSDQCPHFISPENTRKLLVFGIFRGCKMGAKTRSELMKNYSELSKETEVSLVKFI